MAMEAKVLEVVMQDLCTLFVKWSLSSISEIVQLRVKFSTCTLHGVALTWWKSHVKTFGHDAAHGVPWNTLMKMMTVKYFPRNEIKIGDGDLGFKGKGRMFPEESDKIEKYVGGLPDMIHGSVTASKSKTLLGLVRKGSMVDLCQNVLSETIIIMVHVHRSATSATRLATWPVIAGVMAMLTLGHFKKECPKLKNNNRGNQGGNGNAPAKVYVVGNAGINPDSNVVTGKFLLNNCYAYILFDTSADKCFMSTAFSSQIDIKPTTLDYYYDVELSNGKIIRINTIIRGCTLNLLNHPFNIDLMPVELGSFDVIIGMDWLAKYPAVIVCAEKIVCIPWGNETLIVRGNESDLGNETRLNIISCTKIQKYMLKGCHVFLAHVTTKKTKDKSEGKPLEDVSIVRDFPKVFPEDLLGLLPTR
ncbi:putative reverse transcriptase domain-containing protein [Tanacetum coccineum]